jgi:hypothetical protein
LWGSVWSKKARVGSKRGGKGCREREREDSMCVCVCVFVRKKEDAVWRVRETVED